ncbi:acyltransferase [Piscirickettsia salmonis]|uniref:Acyltransferase YihG n=1 Tax=Piscirickettsia salmonis TaxID=1238 RepID=A0A9Q6PU41_PISSA|nr:lysophospholipid acyltransferase family protein [Piscirickettsia salmonis]ALA23551.1 acyltransferase family protein [Piscirickettsia salmonis]APS44001.1 acyltransferase [Piscirickettsia salmonis]APS47359.1 acyltransferase [Piscirickettsia salmonis]APS51205.1 acyltransferase [Piscirickettsia salmonis]APS54414.1 acyltransferase [Piscirickettsia salmonis]
MQIQQPSFFLKATSLIRSIVYYLIVGIVTLFISITSIITLLLPFKVRYRYIMAFCPIALFCARWICGIRYEIQGQKHLANEKVAVIISNHQSAWETFLFPAMFPPLAIIIKQSLLKIPFWGWSFASLEPIAINRHDGKKALLQILRQSKAAVAKGRWIVIYPEGTRSEPGQLATFKKGSGVLAASLHQPIFPIAHDAGKCWPKNSFIKYPGTIHVRIGKKIDTADKTHEQINTECYSWIKEQLQRFKN